MLGLGDQFAAHLPIIRVINYLISLLLIGLAKFLNAYWKQILALSLAMMLLPGSSSTYMTIFMLPSLLLFLNAEPQISPQRIIILVGFICMTVVFPLLNNDFVLALRSVADVPNRLSALMLLNEVGELILLAVILVSECVALKCHFASVFGK